MTRISMSTEALEPSRSTWRSCSTRKILMPNANGILSTSSRKIVPWWAYSNLPIRAFLASVKAPASWPKSSASIIDSGKAAQLMATKGPLLRLLCSCKRRAVNSLPVPVSPQMRVFTSALASRVIFSLRLLMTGDCPIMVSLSWAVMVSFKCRFSCTSWRLSSPRFTTSNRCSRRNGFSMKS